MKINVAGDSAKKIGILCFGFDMVVVYVVVPINRQCSRDSRGLFSKTDRAGECGVRAQVTTWLGPRRGKIHRDPSVPNYV